MIVPKFWAEGRVQERTAEKQVTVRRFGWSDESQAAAQAMADARAKEALAEILSGQTIARRELKRPYNGSVGVPIREEIVATYGETVLTRNSYGAVCLNTPNILFADIDFNSEPSCVLSLAVVSGLAVAGIIISWMIHSWLAALLLVISAIIFGAQLSYKLHSALVNMRGGAEQAAKDCIEQFLQAHPMWSLRLYRTPAGLRVLVTHATFDPNDPAVTECFRALGTDPIYVRMCQRQQCFRARVSPKPWRIGISQHLRPRPGVWPIDPDRLPERRHWIEEYERAATSFASCKFIESLGAGTVHPAVADVQRIHDELCHADSTLPIA